MKKKITLITSILLILALAVTFVGCNKDKTEETPTTTEKVSTTEPTKFEAPEIKDEPTTEETTEATTEAPETTTKKSTYTGSGSSGSSGSSNSGSSSSKPASTTKASSNVVAVTGEKTTNKDGLSGYYVSDNIFFVDDESVTGGHGDDSGNATDPDLEGAIEADKNPDAWGR